MAGPMEQFEIKEKLRLPELGGVDVSFTNISMWMMIAAAVVVGFFALTAKKNLIPGRLQSVGELTYEFIADMIQSTIGPEGMKFFPYIFSLFGFVLACNLIGMNAFGFTVTSHLAVTVGLAMLTILLVVGFGLYKNGLKFFKLFLPSGLPILLIPFIIVIEIISFISRPISLSVRLFANMMAGHVMLKIFATFIAFLVAKGGIWIGVSILPIIGTAAFVALEFLVAFLQAFVFAILSCIYLNDAFHVEH